MNSFLVHAITLLHLNAKGQSCINCSFVGGGGRLSAMEFEGGRIADPISAHLRTCFGIFS
jgi:hypothetical protein